MVKSKGIATKEDIEKKDDLTGNKLPPYETSNFHVFVWLLLNGHRPEVIWEGGKADFVFEDFRGREKLIDDFYANELLQKYIATEQEAKTMMYAKRPPDRY